MVMGRSRTRVALFTAALTLACAAPAFGDTASSPNWSGYVAHHRGVRFSRVLAQWTQPGATCTPGSPSYSSIWVGLGGFEGSSRVEQIGTELDCTAAGQAVASAWYDL